MCGRLYFHRDLAKCLKCGGMTKCITDREMEMGGRWQGRDERSVL
jgi:hypothetical protein